MRKVDPRDRRYDASGGMPSNCLSRFLRVLCKFEGMVRNVTSLVRARDGRDQPVDDGSYHRFLRIGETASIRRGGPRAASTRDRTVAFSRPTSHSWASSWT